jgi:hypothetical protein
MNGRYKLKRDGKIRRNEGRDERPQRKRKKEKETDTATYSLENHPLPFLKKSSVFMLLPSIVSMETFLLV